MTRLKVHGVLSKIKEFLWHANVIFPLLSRDKHLARQNSEDLYGKTPDQLQAKLGCVTYAVSKHVHTSEIHKGFRALETSILNN